MLKIGDKVKIRGIEGIHVVEANDSEHLPLRAAGETFTVYGQCYDDDAIAVELVKEPFEFRSGDTVRIKGDSELSVGVLRFNNKPDSDIYPFMVFGKTFSKQGELFTGEGSAIELVERLEPQSEPKEFTFELHDKVAIKGYAEHFILHPNDLNDSEDYPFKAVSPDGESFGVTSGGKTDISVDITLIDRPDKITLTKVVDGVEVLDVGNYRLRYKSDLLCDKVKKSNFVELTIERGDGMLWGTCKIGDNLITATGVSEEDLKANMSKVIFDFEGAFVEFRTTWVEAVPKEDVTEAQLETFTKGVEHAEKLLKPATFLSSRLSKHEMVNVTFETIKREEEEAVINPEMEEIAKSQEFNDKLRETAERLIKRVEVRSVLHPLDSTLPVKCQVVEGGKLPTYAHDGDAGMDLYVREVEAIEGKNLVKYHLGIKLDLDEGYAAFIYPRSSVYKTQHLMTNCVGVVDSSYKGEISAVMACRTPYEIGDRACQMVIMPVPKVRLVEVEELRDSPRGSNGYGSSGK